MTRLLHEPFNRWLRPTRKHLARGLSDELGRQPDTHDAPADHPTPATAGAGEATTADPITAESPHGARHLNAAQHTNDPQQLADTLLRATRCASGPPTSTWTHTAGACASASASTDGCWTPPC